MHKLAAYREDKMGLTLAEKILKSHTVDGEFKKGCEIGLKIDQTPVSYTHLTLPTTELV